MSIDTTLKKDTLKEYYVNLQTMYNNAVNMLTAINQSLQTTSTDVLVNIMDTDDTYTTIRIPSFLYLENKLEQLESNFNSLFNIPEAGEAWFNLNDGMQKLELVKATTAPLRPSIGNTTDIYVQSEINNFLRDLVNPKTFIRFYIDNLPNNINNIFVKKVSISSQSIFNALQSANSSSLPLTYERFKNLVYNLTPNNDYYEYDFELKTPIKRDKFRSYFEILSIPQDDGDNPWIDYTEDSHAHTRYKLRLSSLSYYDKDDSAYEFRLKTGDLLCLDNENVIYKIINISTSINALNEKESIVIVEEQIGHQVLQTTAENSSMILRLYNEDFSDYKYVDVPLEEDPFIIIYIGTIYNNVRSILSYPVFVDLNKIEVRDSDGNQIMENGSPMNYITYYNKFCNNIGDLIAGLSETVYPQLSNYSSTDMFELTEDAPIAELVNNSVLLDGPLQVVKINTHLTDDDAVSDLKKWHEEKNRFTNDLVNVQHSIDQIYNQLISTDFSTDTSVTQFELQEKLTKYYNERTLLTSQKINAVENINIYRNEIKNYAKSKFRVRGITNPTQLIAYIKNKFGDRTDIIGIDIRYKYVTSQKETSNNVIINSSVYSDWVKQPSLDRDRKLIYNTNHTSYRIDFVNYDETTNPIKWNQIDIPIVQGEDVVLQVRYKLNIGQPFINIYTPWSTEITQQFPNEMKEVTELTTIIKNNEDDTISAMFNKTLINDGYTEHISDKLIDNAKIFYHSADKINSGFMNTTNNVMSVKEKFDEIDSEVLKYRTLIEKETNSEFEVYVAYEGELVQLHQDVINALPLFTDNADQQFIKKNLKIIIKNTGKLPLELVTMFPGKRNVNIRNYNNDVAFSSDVPYHYENVLLLHGNSNKPEESIFEQTCGQWIYFRNDNPDTYEKLYSSRPLESYGANDIVYMQSMYNPTDNVQPCGNFLTITEGIPDYSKYKLIFEHIVEQSTKKHLSVGQNITNDTDIRKFPVSVLVPNPKNREFLLCEIDKTDNSQKKVINSNQEIAIPLVFESYLTEQIKAATNTIAFTFRPSRLAIPVTYVLQVGSQV